MTGERPPLGGDAFAEPLIADPIFEDPPEQADTEPISNDGDPGKDVPVEQSMALGPARHVEMTIIAQDPAVRCADGTIQRATVRVAADRFRPPFQTHRFQLVSYDPSSAGPGPEFRLLDLNGRFKDRFEKASDAALIASNDFHAQNAYAIAARTLAEFEAALGRRVPWDFPGHQLYVVPHGEIRANAYYSPDRRALIFGVVPDLNGQTAYSCLSHDIVAHETTHAILDGLRPGYFNPSLPDQGGFHEGFADVVALLSVFSVPEVVQLGLGPVVENGVIKAEEVTRPKLMDSVLVKLAEQFGEAIHGKHGRPLRESVKLPPGAWWRNSPDYTEVHNRGEILVAAIANCLLDMWIGRLKVLLNTGQGSRQLAGEEGAKAAEHLLRMCIRAIDYCPPVEFEFEDFLDAVIWSDEQIAPDDEHGYRKAILDNFARYDIHRPPQHAIDVTKLAIRPRYDRFNFAALRSDPDEVFRFIWENDELLGLSLAFETRVDAVRPAVRVGPDGFVLQETVVTYTQQVVGPAEELASLSLDPMFRYRTTTDTLAIPAQLDPKTNVQMYGGGAIIFDQFGRAKLHLNKPLLDWRRQSARLAYLVARQSANRAGTLGAATFFSKGEPLAALHRPDPLARERW